MFADQPLLTRRRMLEKCSSGFGMLAHAVVQWRVARLDPLEALKVKE